MIALLKQEWRLILFGFLMTLWSAPGQTFFISLFSAELRQELGLSHGQFGSYYSIGTLLSAIVVVWSGALIDRVDLRKFALAIILGLVVACLSLSFSTSAITLIASLFLLRHFGQGLMFLTASTTVVRYLQAGRGKANAISSMGYSASEAVFPSLVVLMIATLGWRMSWRLTALTLLVVSVPLTIGLIRNHPARHQQYLDQLNKVSDETQSFTRRHWRRSEVLRDVRFYLFVPNLMSQTLLFTGFIFHQVELVASKGWALTTWTGYFAVYAAVSITMKFVAGYLVDRFSATALVPLHTVPLLAAMLCIANFSASWAALVFLVLMGVTSGVQSTIGTPFLAEQYGNKFLGSIKSMMSSVMVFVSAMSPFAMGLLMDNGITLQRQAAFGAVITTITIVMASVAYGLSIKQRR